MMRPLSLLAALLAFLVVPLFAASGRADDGVVVAHALAEFGTPRLGPDFDHFAYVNPDAPRGGSVRLASTQPFDTLNNIPLQGIAPRNIGLIYDTLMAEPQDELSVFYGLIAETVEYPQDLSWLTFNLRPDARWHDGRPVTADDVAWTFEAIMAHGEPFLRSVYEDVADVAVLGERRVRFSFKTRDTMTPLVRVANLVVLPRHWWEADGRDIAASTLEPPLGSGPYRLVGVDAGRRLVYERVDDYWAADLPVRRGLFNFDRIEYDYYLDRDVMAEAFRSGAYDFRQSYSSRDWATGYDVPAADDGRLHRLEIPVREFRGIQGFFMNTRRPMFADRRVRQALTLLFNFEFVNQTLMYGLYERMDSYFPGSEYAAAGLPEGLERDFLEPYRSVLPEEVFTRAFVLPTNSGTRLSRDNLRAALALLEEAGWELRDGTLTNVETGAPFAFELLMRGGGGLEPHAGAYADTLRQAGIRMSLRRVDAAQWQARYQDRAFDMIIFAYTFYPPPGSQLRNRFGSAAADEDGSANLVGIRDPAVDGLLEAVVAADDPETKQAAAQALDRALLWGFYVVPHWYKREAWIAFWDRFGFPENHPPYNFSFGNQIGFQPSWWIDAQRDARLRERGR